MDDQRKHAYRYLLYHALLDIRPILWLRFGNPFRWRAFIRQVRRVGAIADWLHNLALFSALDFERFDEERFWCDARSLKERFPDCDVAHYHRIFEEKIMEGESD